MKNNLLINFALKNKFMMFIILVITILGSLTRTIGASYLQKIIDSLNNDAVKVLLMLVFVGYLFMFSGYFFRWLSAVLTLYLTEKLALDTRLKLISHLSRIPFGAYEKYSMGSLQSTLRNDVSIASELLYNLYSRILNNIFLFIFSLWYMILINAKIAIVVGVISLVMGFVNQKILAQLKNPEREQRKSQGKLTQITENALLSINTIKTYNAKSYVLSFFNKERKNYNRQVVQSAVIDMYRLIIYDLVSNFAFYLSIFYLGYMGIKGQMSVGEVIVFIYLVKQILVPVEVIFRWMYQIVRSNVAWGRITDVLNLDESAKQEEVILKNINQVKANNIIFSYDGNSNILDNVQISMSKNEISTISGESGKGKTTFLKVLLGLYDCESAVYEINRKKVDIHNLNGLATFAPSDNQLFNLTVYENLVFGNPNISREKIMSLAKELGFDTWINSLPQGLETLLSETAGNVSGGQKQMISNMRALLSDKEIVVMDEPFSALDAEREKDLIKVLDSLKKEKIFIITSHRKNELFNNANEIVL